LKCKRLGHVNTDKSCPLYGKSRLDEDNADLFNEYDRKASLAEISSSSNVMTVKSEPTVYQEVSVKREVDEEVTLDMLRTLGKKEKKAILKRLLRLEKKAKKSKK
jgi:hypothetical protein